MPLFFFPKNSKSNDPGKVSQKRSNKKNREPTEKKKKTCGENCSCHSTVRLRRSPKHTLRHQPAWQSLYHGEGANFKRPTLSHAAIGFGFSWFSFCPIHCGWKLVAKVVKIWNISLIYSVPTNFDHFPSKFSPTVPVILSLPLSCWTFPVVVVIAGKAKVFLLLQAKKNQVKKCHHLFVPHKFFRGLQRKRRKNQPERAGKSNQCILMRTLRAAASAPGLIAIDGLVPSFGRRGQKLYYTGNLGRFGQKSKWLPSLCRARHAKQCNTIGNYSFIRVLRATKKS